MDGSVNLTNCCRTCLKVDCSLTSISEEDIDSLKYYDKLSGFITEITWLSDSLPSLICSTCIDRLRVAYDFRLICLQSDQTLCKYVELLSTNSNHSNNLDDSPLNITSKRNTCSIETFDIERQQNVDYVQLKHFLENDVDINRSENVVPEGCTGPDNTCTEIISTSNLSVAKECITEPKEQLNEQDDLQKQNEQNIKQQSIYEIPLMESEETVITDLESNIFHSSNNDKSDIVSSVPRKQVIKRTTGIQARPETISSENALNSQKGEKQFTCSHCDKSYRKNSNLRIHMRTHTGEKPFECHYCEKRFYHSSHLREHIRRHTGEKPFQCAVCNKRFTIKGELNMHMKSHTGEKPYACTCCDRRCLTAADLKIHMRTHTGEKPFSCGTCGRKFASTYILNSHVKTHTGERPFSCNQCGKTFTQSSHLNAHMRKHTGEKVCCKMCFALFSHSSQLTVHMRKHTGKQPYKCNICEKVCNYASELQSHMNKHTGFKYKCSTCDKRFTTLSYLNEHTRTHTGENLSTCAICERQFTRHQYLEKHMRTHTGEKPYTCFICNKAFTQSSSLNVHIRIHTGEKPHACELCDKKFTTSSDLTSHIKQHKKLISL